MRRPSSSPRPRALIGAGLALLGLAGCTPDAGLDPTGRVVPVDPAGLDDYVDPPEPIGQAVAATVETAPVGGVGDSADDPAIWVHPTNPSLSLILGTDKGVGGGIYLYELDGSVRQFLALGEVNNVDLRNGFLLGGQATTLVTGVNRTTNTLVVLALDPVTRMLRDVAARAIEVASPGYGSCMYAAADGDFYAFIDTTAGDIEQYRLFEDAGEVDAELVRSFCVDTQPEACVADDELAAVYFGEEARGIWEFVAEPDAPPVGSEVATCDGAIAGTLVDTTDGGVLTADVEGLALATTGPGQGFLVVSSQGAHEFVMYERAAPHAFLRAFHVFGGGPSCIDGVEGSDGIDVTAASLGPAFPHGVFVTQDGFNGDPVAHQNFKLVPLEAILDEVPGANPACRLGDYGGRYRLPEQLPGPEHTPEFCAAFCGRCATCYATTDAALFSEGDCHYQSPKPDFVLEDCLTGCNAGVTPADTSPLQPGWELWECLALDDAL